MIYAALPELPGGKPRPLPFYLAMEEHLARNYPAGEYFFMWQVEPTVIFGRCQNPRAELNVDFCKSNGIQTYRRKSGGGCVYADMNNIMFSYITASSEVVTTFTKYCQMVADTLCQLGLDASTTGRNDVLIGDRKVSGNAFYHLRGRSIVHGTMLYDADLQTMSQAITPSTAKLQAKGVSSVRSHVTTIREHLPNLSISEFKTFCRTHLCDSEIVMTPKDIAAIEKIAEEYFTDEWIWGRFANSDERNTAPERRRIDGVGEFAPTVLLDPPADPGSPAKIRKVSLQGDFFLLSDLDDGLLNHLIGVDFTHEAILNALKSTNPGNVIAGLTAESFSSLFSPSPR
jgi:lipoic acid synthetase/lipoate-protein ligase A